MPLRDHFHPPLLNRSLWDALHGGWPMVICQQLNPQLPDSFVASPQVHLGPNAEIDIGTFEQYDANLPHSGGNQAGGVLTASWTAPPAVRLDTEPPDYDEYEVRIYDERNDRRLVAAIEIVSPANKDRPESRNAFVGKCAAMLRQGVAVSIVDVVTTRRFNLYHELMTSIGHPDPTMRTDPPPIYAASCRWLLREPKARLESWSHTLAIGQPLPQLPLWLGESLVMPLDLEPSYEQACRDLKIK
jgi:hypothetical protein